MSGLRILIPFSAVEACSIEEAARIAGCSGETIRRWVSLHHLGRKIGGRWRISRAALHMHLDGDKAALKALLSGDRMSPMVRVYLDAVESREKVSTNSTSSTNAINDYSA